MRYDNARKLWIYLHRGRSEEEFGVFSSPSSSCLHWSSICRAHHWASEVAAKQRKYFMMSRPKIKPVGGRYSRMFISYVIQTSVLIGDHKLEIGYGG